ncbi:nitrite/sulfite reductase [Clostridium cylindrosporum]|uniref:Ferredoxin--nitrite reductase NasD n=1 Tax=Clostridium cylindrosporum DSM 605 TaxID=1121307 RepID=A0A0J8G6V7_CLOCY|nr:nitrite/sulfite reductase [Clostridium cylindrosporum]KMT23326.1 ferredoxin--nitrite reductase NasD [Clostridium cylindrosporum DSM 605]
MFTVNEFIDIFEKSLSGEDVDSFKKYSSLMGIYTERNDGRYMIRYRFNGGVIKPTELEGIANVLKELEFNKIHFTTRQDLQFHRLTAEELKKVLSLCEGVGISSRGTGGPSTRNIQISPLSGVVKDEDYDITPYVLKATNYVLNDDPIYTLPKKYKVSVSNNFKDTVNATISDLGIITKKKSGKKGFKVYGAGGLGNSPNVSILLCEFDEAENILYHILAMRKIFDEHGDREVRAKARIRHILKRLGEEEFRNLYISELEEFKKDPSLKIVLSKEDEEAIEKSYEKYYETGYDAHPLIKFGRYRNIITKQKQRGYYSLYIHPHGGDMSYDEIVKILDVIKGLDYEVSLRLTNTQGFYVRDIKSNDVEKFLNALPSTETEDIFTSVSCTGAGTCKLGILKSKNLLHEIVRVFKDEKKSIRKSLPRVYISGCPNSCGQHLKGEIGLCGRAKKAAKGLVPYFGIFVNGNLSENPSLGYEIGAIPARNIPSFFVELAGLKLDSKIKGFKEFYEENKSGVESLIEKYSQFDEENDEFYTEFGVDEKFELKVHKK